MGPFLSLLIVSVSIFLLLPPPPFLLLFNLPLGTQQQRKASGLVLSELVVV